LNDIKNIIESASTTEIATAIDGSFREIGKHYVLRNWKTAGIDSGHFVEAVRRFLEHVLFGSATPIGKSLSKFNDAALKSYESATGDEAYRILIPRLLWAIYALRNKRSIGHLGAVPPSEIDASLLLHSAKWVVAEIIRLNAKGSVQQTRDLVDAVVQRTTSIIWIESDIVRVLDKSLSARDQTLVILGLTGSRSEDFLRDAVGYKHKTNFRKILNRLHADRLVEYSREKLTISPTGMLLAEALIAKRASVV
jgi:hypothetical protein